MKLMRIFALLLALLLCLTACSKNEEPAAAPTAAPAEDSQNTFTGDESVLIKAMDRPYEEWMKPELYSAFAAMFFMDVAYTDACGITELSEVQGIPAVYVGELEGDNYGNGMNLCMFYTNPENGEITMLKATVYLKTYMFDVVRTENVGDMTAAMDKLVSDGFLKVYHPVTQDEFMTAYSYITQAMSGTAQ